MSSGSSSSPRSWPPSAVSSPHRPPIAEERAPTRVAEITVADEDVDLISGLLWTAGVTAVAEHDAGPGSTLLRTDLPAGGADALRATVGHLCEVREVVVDDDGLDAWRDHAEVVVAGERLVVRPPWVPLDRGAVPDGSIVLEIDPGHSFGHGAHPTTRLCLQEVERACREGVVRSVLDVGCGSGVLAVAAAALGVLHVTACDIDEAAVTATGANAERNKVADHIEVVHVADAARPLEGLDGPYDLVVANIGAATLVEIAVALVARAAGDGRVVISGLLDPVDDQVLEAFGPWRPERVEVLDRWVAVVLRSPAGAARDSVGDARLR